MRSGSTARSAMLSFCVVKGTQVFISATLGSLFLSSNCLSHSEAFFSLLLPFTVCFFPFIIGSFLPPLQPPLLPLALFYLSVSLRPSLTLLSFAAFIFLCLFSVSILSAFVSSPMQRKDFFFLNHLCFGRCYDQFGF